MNTKPLLDTDLSLHIWDTKYRHKINGSVKDHTIKDTWSRVAGNLAKAETHNRKQWKNTFFRQLYDFKFLPGGRIIAGLGTKRQVTLFNCFVMGIIEDSISSIFENIKEGALTMQWGGGIGYDFSTLRPKGSLARSTNNISSGPVSFMKIWDAMCDTMMSTGARRGAMMGTLRCDHPDIASFIAAKSDSGTLANFNLSVLVTDAFMNALRKDEEWHLIFPVADTKVDSGHDSEIVLREWPGKAGPVPCRIFDTVKARELWLQIMESNYRFAEPGVLFIDRINRLNNLHYSELISCTNPCGEVPLPPYGACNLGSVNLTRFVRNPFTEEANLDFKAIRETTSVAVRILDNVINLSLFPLEVQKNSVYRSRRIGIGITGLADALIMLNRHYGSEAGRETAGRIMEVICHEAYRSSIDLAKERGHFPDFVAGSYLESPFIRKLPNELQKEINNSGIRNSHLISIAPTGSISLLAGNISSGIEPVYDYEYTRAVLNTDATTRSFKVTDYAYRLWRETYGTEVKLPESFVKARELTPEMHLKMQEVLQQYVDNSISKTINVPQNYPFSSFKEIYDIAYDKGLKGCTTFRPNKTRGSVFSSYDSEQKKSMDKQED